MLAQVHFPQTLQPGELDRYLSEGWFRMGQTIFTTNFLNFKQQIYSAVWLRVVLDQCSDNKLFKKLTRVNSAFSIEIQEASIKPAQEDLFARYKKEVMFEASPSLEHLLFGKATHNVYATQEVNVYDAGKLIASGFFDVDKNSAAGITSYYDPAYKKYSLGKYLIFLKADYCKKLGLKYFYPGYFVPGYPAFDYKLKMHPHALQYLQLRSQKWLAIRDFSSEYNPVQRMHEKLSVLQSRLSHEKIESRILNYDYYDANLIHEISHMELFDFPLFLDYFDVTDDMLNSLIVYDIRDDRYHWMAVRSVWASNEPAEKDGHYSSYLLKVAQEIYSAPSPEEMAATLSTMIRSKVMKQKLG